MSLVPTFNNFSCHQILKWNTSSSKVKPSNKSSFQNNKRSNLCHPHQLFVLPQNIRYPLLQLLHQLLHQFLNKLFPYLLPDSQCNPKPTLSETAASPPPHPLSPELKPTSEDDDLDHLKFLFDEPPQNHLLIPQSHIDYLSAQVSKQGGILDYEKLKNACLEHKISVPKQLPKKTAAKQVQNIIYALAVAAKKQKDDPKRYLRVRTFCYKSENIATSMFHSKSLTNKHSKIPKESHSKLRYFLKQCEYLDTSPENIKWLISLLSKSFYRRENKSYDGTYGTFNHTSYYALHFSKILSLLMRKLILSKNNDDILTLFDLTCPLYCDIVLFHNIDSPHPKDFFIKHGKIIKLFYSLRDQYNNDPSCANSFLYYIPFSVYIVTLVKLLT